MDRSAYDSLSPRELECLRLVAQGLLSKEIADRLVKVQDGAKPRTLTANTVDGYIKSAMSKLGVTRRREAAALVAAYEETPPRWLGDQPPGVEDLPSKPPSSTPTTHQGQASFPWPWRRRGEVNNELGIATRLLWIPILAMLLAIAMGSLANGFRVIADFAWPNRSTGNR